MKSILLPAALLLLLLCAGLCDSGPVDGRIRQNHAEILHPGETLLLQKTFKANERACVIVIGDHKPVMNLRVTILDANKQEVARDEGGDVLAAIWYPGREATYTIRIEMVDEAKVHNELQLIFK